MPEWTAETHAQAEALLYSERGVAPGLSVAMARDALAEIERLQGEWASSERVSAARAGQRDELCVEYHQLLTRAEEAEARLARAQEALEWYADPEVWCYDTKLATLGWANDISEAPHPEFADRVVLVGGKRAREALAYLKGEGNG